MKTLEELIANQDRYDINKITYFTVTEDGTLVIPDTNLFHIYRKYINDYVVTYKVSDSQRLYYRRKPYLLARDIYGSPKLAELIMILNDQECPSKFYLKNKINIIPLDSLNDMYDSIVANSSDRLEANWAEYLSLTDD